MSQELSDAGFGAKMLEASSRSPEERIRDTLIHQLHIEYGRSEAEARQYAESFLDGDRFVKGVAMLVNEFRIQERDVLEVGAGLGGMLLEMKRRGFRVTGLEPSEEWCDIIRKRFRKEGLDENCIVHGYGEALPFPDNSTDFILSMQVLEHVKDVPRVMSEMNRVLRPGAIAYITAPNYFSFAENHYRVKWFPGLPPKIGAWYLKRLGRNPSFYLNHVNNVTYVKIMRIAGDLKWIDRVLGHRSRRSRYRRHLKRMLEPEITYIFQKPG
jgi:SAM-dependent methyltransferase